LLSAASLPPYYRYPKQDYMGALQFVNARKAVTDTVSAVGMAANVYRTYYAPGLDFPATRAELAALRGPGHSIWILYSFPRDMRIRFAEIYAYLRANAQIIKVFPGTVGDGTIYVARIDGAGD